MKIAYVLEDAGPSGGARVVLEHCNGLAKRGHDVTLYTVTAMDPRSWFRLSRVKHISTGSCAALLKALKAFDGHKVATWWRTAPIVAESGGMGYYLIQDIETSYSPDDARECAKVMATYRLPLKKITEGHWVDRRVAGGTYIGIAIDHGTYMDLGMVRQKNQVLYAYRGHHLKGPELFRETLPLLPDEIGVVTFGWDSPPSAKNVTHLGFLSDKAIVEQYNRASVYVSTSTHEGFNLPCLEAMACGCPVITTNADGNMEFCIDGFNCLIVERDPRELAEAILRVCEDRQLAGRLAKNGIATAQRYRWENVIDRLEAVFR